MKTTVTKKTKASAKIKAHEQAMMQSMYATDEKPQDKINREVLAGLPSESENADNGSNDASFTAPFFLAIANLLDTANSFTLNDLFVFTDYKDIPRAKAKELFLKWAGVMVKRERLEVRPSCYGGPESELYVRVP